MDTTAKKMTSGSVEVQEAGRALKVHTETPHLVSLGGGRLSTAVTLHPLPEGRTTIGSGPGADIHVQGTGVEAVHCHIDNSHGLVTITPLGELTSVDNLRLSYPTRLTQGCMLCVGRSNYLRFNHPAEARLMRSVLPSRISIAPMLPGEESGGVGEGKPPAAPRRSWDSLGSDEIARYISPKVFPAGSSTVNSPAALVLGHRASQGKLTMSPMKLNGDCEVPGPGTRSSSAKLNGEAEPRLNGNIYQNVCALPNGQYVPRTDSPFGRLPRVHSPSPPTTPRYNSTPSPAFDRNPSYPFRRSVTSPTPSHEESARRDQDTRWKQMESEQLVEQEADKLERQRLDEILVMCADYEKQAQWERLNKPPQNRIITNGSLPRDKRLPSPNSPHFHQSFTYDSESVPPSPIRSLEPDLRPGDSSDGVPSSPRTRIRTVTTPSREHALEVIENRLAILNDYEILGPPPPPRNSSRNAVSSPEPRGNTSHPTSPSQPKTNNCKFEYEQTNNKVIETSLPYKPGTIAEANAMSKYEFFGFNPRNSHEFPSYQNVPSFQKSTESLLSDSSKRRDSLRSTSTQTSVTKSRRKSDAETTWTSADLMAMNCNGDTIKRQDVKNGEYSTEQLIMQLDAIVRESMRTCDRELTPSPGSSERDSGIAETAARDSGIVEAVRDSEVEESDKFILPLPDTSTHAEVLNSLTVSTHAEHQTSVNTATRPHAEGTSLNTPHAEILTSLLMERTQLIANLTTLKAKAIDIEQQEEELMRELEIERALVGGEQQAQSERLTGEEQRVASLRQRVSVCEREMDNCVSQQAERQTQLRQRLDQQQQVLCTLEQQLRRCGEDSELRAELVESCRQQQELLEAERKSFEELEFTLLEEEAGWLSRREELQREVSEAMSRCAERRQRLCDLQMQHETAERSANTTTRQLEAQLQELLTNIDQGRKRLREIDAQMQNPNTALVSQQAEKKQSQDDIERISRVTSGAPIEMSSNSLGRRTIASLQEIERNRQLHLAKQGSQVIEDERKRVSELKRRVQDQARQEWEQRRRENNCNSLNSIGSEESSVASSDLHIECTSSEDAEKRLQSETSENKIDEASSEQPAEQPRQEDRKEEGPAERPLSQSRSEDQLSVRLRAKTSSNHQRPLTRYLPIRGASLDLRQHIESAGHQPDLCPHVLLDHASCRGFLHKMTSRFHHWNKRWFVFDRSKRTLTYYTDRSERKPRGGAYFQAIEEVYVDHSNGVKSPNPAVTFVIKSSERTYHLVAPSPEAMRIWVDVIFTGAEGYQEFAHGS